MSKYNRQFSPERAKGRTERSPTYVLNRKVPVIYYLCRNQQLEHPHFMEVPLSSPEALYLRDVIERLNALRGKGMASMYSWSCKRSYKNGFVWHDLCEDDLIVPAHANEYVLKGSEVVEDSNKGHNSRAARIQNVKQLTEAQVPLSRSQEDTTSSTTSMNDKDTKHHHHHHHQEDEISPPSRSSGSSGVSPESIIGNGGSSTWPRNNSLTPPMYKTCKREGAAADAATQTEENCTRKPFKPSTETCVSDTVSTNHGGKLQNNTHQQKILDSWICKNSISAVPSSSNLSSTRGEPSAETLEALIRSDANKPKNLGAGSSGTTSMASQHDVKMKASNVLMQLISCGSITVKENSYGLVPAYRPQFSQLKFPSPLYSTSMMLGELDCLWENPRLTGLRSEDKEYFSGSLLETKMHNEEDGHHVLLKRSNSYDAERTPSKQQVESNSVIKEDEEESTKSPSRPSKCLPRSIKSSFLTKQLQQHPRSESMRSPILPEKPRRSSARPSDASSKRTTEHSLTDNNQSQRVEDEDKVIQTEES